MTTVRFEAHTEEECRAAFLEAQDAGRSWAMAWTNDQGYLGAASFGDFFGRLSLCARMLADLMTTGPNGEPVPDQFQEQHEGATINSVTETA